MDFNVTVRLNPIQVAEAFWELNCEEQADFFAQLSSISGHALCIQMAAVFREIAHRSERGDYAAMNGFRTMLAHSQAYAESATENRAWEAKRAIAKEAALAASEE